MKVLMIVTSHSTLGNSDKKTGLWLEELTTPFYIFKEQGASIVISSPLGGEAPIDPASVDIQHDSISAFKRDTHLKSQLAQTKKLSEIDPSEFDILFFPGGHGPLWDLAENIDTAQIIKQFINAHKVIAAVCHGLAVFKNVVINNTHYLAGKAATGFSNQEEEIAGLQHIVPFSIQDMLIQNGAE
ncbi:MAG: type 1 glutamine amidotransferase domain-containing protein [Pseudomonadota bacterium]|nr:type 1 glutamine amidotransferase domain-containing protein [Pseudomonadota bacterium]